MSISDHEISFLLDNTLHQFRFNGDTSLADTIRKALKKDLKTVDSSRWGDVQVYPVGGCAAGGAEGLLETLIDALCLDEGDLEEQGVEAVRALAVKVDKKADACKTPQPYLVEFIWDNGGGDDNPFADSFAGDPKQFKLSSEFANALEQWMEDNSHGYQFTWGIESEQHPLLTVDEAIEATIEVLNEVDITGAALDGLLQAKKLEASTPAATGHKRRRAL